MLDFFVLIHPSKPEVRLLTFLILSLFFITKEIFNMQLIFHLSLRFNYIYPVKYANFLRAIYFLISYLMNLI
jgi:hypothetical protein